MYHPFSHPLGVWVGIAMLNSLKTTVVTFKWTIPEDCLEKTSILKKFVSISIRTEVTCITHFQTQMGVWMGVMDLVAYKIFYKDNSPSLN